MLLDGGMLNSAQATARKFVHNVTDQIGDSIGSINTKRIKKTALKTTARMTDAVKDHPIAAVLIGLGAGYLVMRLVKR